MDLPDSAALSEMSIRLGAAAAFGCALGIDREVRGKPAGVRTHMLIALGAAVTAVLTLELYDRLLLEYPENRADPLRIIEGVMTGVGFLGAGAIIRSGGDVRGLTSAANIWICGAIGLACGAGLYVIAGVAFAFALGVLTVRWFGEVRLSPNNNSAGGSDSSARSVDAVSPAVGTGPAQDQGVK